MPRSKEFDCEKALDDAMNVFWEKGYQGTSIRDLVEATGVNRASLYGTFGGKHQIFEKALERFRQAANHNLDRQTAKYPPGLRRIQAAFRIVADETVRDPRGCPIVNCVGEAPTGNLWLTNAGKISREGLERFFETCLNHARGAGEIPKAIRVRPLARYLTNAVLGMRVLAHMQPDKSLIDDIVTTTLAALH